MSEQIPKITTTADRVDHYRERAQAFNEGQEQRRARVAETIASHQAASRGRLEQMYSTPPHTRHTPNPEQ